MKNIYVLICFLLISLGYAQVGIGTYDPNPNSALDVTSTTKGVIFPRLTIAQRNAIVSPLNGLFIYQTDGVNPPPGIYSRQGGWNPITGPASNWLIYGRSGLLPASNFIGTTDAQPLIFRTNNVERMRILANGRVGIGTTAPSTILHIVGADALRIEDGTEGDGKILRSSANGTPSWVSPGSILSTDWDTFGNAGTTNADFLGTTDLQDLAIRTNNTEKIRVQADGNIRIGLTSAANSQLEVRGNMFNGSAIKATNNYDTPGTQSYGVIATTLSTQMGSNSLKGQCYSLSTTISEIGVLGRYATSGAGIFGLAYNSNATDFDPGKDYGVFGTVNWSSGIGVYGKNLNLTIGSAYGMYCEGNFAVGGGGTSTNGSGVPIVKAATVPTTKGNQLVYCKESPELWFEDFGSGELRNGSAHISLDELFLETVKIDGQNKMHVTLQEQAETQGLYVIVDRDNKGFTVKEKKNGSSNGTFSYSIMAKRRFYQDIRFGVDGMQPFENNMEKAREIPVASTDPMVVKAYIEKTAAEKNTKLIGDKAPKTQDAFKSK